MDYPLLLSMATETLYEVLGYITHQEIAETEKTEPDQQKLLSLRELSEEVNSLLAYQHLFQSPETLKEIHEKYSVLLKNRED